ncbi:hypothetical protein FRACYDRAFT_269797 [Fragilariopsis cylindrus CCMP1102]|uniref:Uncharacterized protein n=1 Tax=Fragilariopsis cylindrus CCMP1102 TaxID=635003 RepID=A0A1E7F5C6_9STRA|nr:hypothetical protein FRACYDRAFT_269797 [Fragilariopsis cylindrus CCMP1102]|eukprot:OEU13391.1 hypothetical protein FRACYDRAFT_269797 [Fragilariopsis cylindrus CCMP1102]
MKYSTSLAVLLAVMPSSVYSFTAPTNTNSCQSTRSCSHVSLSANRREILETAVASAAGIASFFVLAPPQEAMAEARPMYLSEPTDEFKENEAKGMAFKREQLAVKKEFNAALDTFLNEANDSDALVKDLKDLQNLIVKAAGLPLGIKKDDLFKQIRSKKGKGFWPVPAEVAYQSLIGEIRFQQSPNLDKENGNPYQ